MKISITSFAAAGAIALAPALAMAAPPSGGGAAMNNGSHSTTTAAPNSPTGNGGGYNHTNSPQRSEEHTSELQSRFDLVCRLLLEKKKRESTGTRASR